MQQPKQGSSLSRSLGLFANALSGVCVFLLAPLAAQFIRPEMQDYLSKSFPHEYALYGSWGFVVLLSLCVYFGLSALFQMIAQLLFYRSVRRGGF